MTASRDRGHDRDVNRDVNCRADLDVDGDADYHARTRDGDGDATAEITTSAQCPVGAFLTLFALLLVGRLAARLPR